MLLNFLVGIVLSHQGINTLNDYGQVDKIPDVLIPIYIRYVGSLISSLVVAGRSGSAFAAEIGSMNLALEINALKAMKISPYASIIVPRIIATTLFLPFLVIFADIAGIIGGMFLANYLIDFPIPSFIIATKELIRMKTLIFALLKNLVFGFTIATIGCYRGLCVYSNAQVLGTMTTRSVVECIFWVIVLDGIISTYYSFLGI